MKPSLDLNILRALSTRDRLTALRASVPAEMVDPNTIEMLRWFDSYFRAHTDHILIDPAALLTHIKLRAKVDPQQLLVFDAIVQQLCSPIDATTLKVTVETLETLRLSGESASLISRYNNGEELDLAFEMQQLTQRTMQQIARTSAAKWADADPLEYIEAAADDSGLQWDAFPALRGTLKGLRPGHNIAIAAPTDAGKCLAPDTLVRMYPTGTKMARDVRSGDYLRGPTGVRKVLGTTSGVAEMYRVSYPWGEYYDVNAPHVLSLVRTCDGTALHPVGEVVNISVQEYLQKPESWKHVHKGWKTAVQYPEEEQQMPAYLLGAWLGDGTTTKPQFTSMDLEIVEEFREHYGRESQSRPAGAARTYDFYRTGMLQDLRELGVLGNKHIPAQYLHASLDQRLELLAGLLDTDGYCTARGAEVTFKQPALAHGLLELARSVGIHATQKEVFKRACGTADTGAWYWKTSLGSEYLQVLRGYFRRPRHATLQSTTKPKRSGLYFGITVTPLGLGEYAGFELDGDHLFLLGDFTVTHNTSLLCELAVSFAKQAHTVYPEQPLLYLLNEGTAEGITPRVYQTALHCCNQELLKAARSGTLREQYAAIVGRWDAIRLVNIHGMRLSQVSRIIEAHHPYMVITDMTGRITANSNHTGGGNDIGQLEEVWNCMRELAAIQQFIHMGTVQVSAEGFDMLFPPLSAMQNSKTGIQTTLDLCLMMGRLNPQTASNMEMVRGISTPKNKLARSGCKSTNQLQVVFDAGTNTWDSGITGAPQ